jgi:predicted amidohydrolase YtcJ
MKKLFTNAIIYTPEKLQGDCLAVDNGRIVDIGPKNRLISLNRHGFKTVDLKGKTVLPGFIDSHLHLLTTGYDLLNVNLSGLDSLEKVLVKIQNAAQKSPAGQWLIGRGWDKNLWGDDFPDKTALDKVCPDNPVRLFSKDGHSIWVNSYTLQLCHIDKSTPDPQSGRILRMPDGSPSGILTEKAVEIVNRQIPDPTMDYKLKALRKTIKYLNSLGITGVADCDWDAGRLQLFDTARQKGFFSLRAFMMLSPDDIDSAAQLGLKTGFGDDFITIGALKLYMDGALGSQTAWMHEPYENNAQNIGVPTLNEDDLEMYFEKTHLKGISLAVHAIGDKANTALLDFFAKKYRVSKKLALRHRIEHAQIVRKEDIPKFRKCDVAASVQPVHAIADRDMAERYWGARSRWAYPFASMIKHGATIAFGSDCPIENPDPMLGIYGAIARKRPGDERDSWYGQECITLRQAVKAYTEKAAGICYWAGRRGVLAPGYDADFVVLSDDIFKVKTERIPDIKILATIVNGEIVHQDKAFKL